MNNPRLNNVSFILSPGTQIVALHEIKDEDRNIILPGGSVGVVTVSPESQQSAYRVRFLNGIVLSVRHEQMVMLARFKIGDIGDVKLTDRGALFDRVIFRCVIGSRAYGLDDASSDVDYRGIYLPTADQHWSLHGVPEQIECDETQEAYWEIQKFIVLALKANPNVLECLYTPLIELTTPLARELLNMRSCFLSRMLYQTFNGYAMSQFKKMQGDIRNQGTVKWKHVMHLLRVLISGIHALTHGEVQVEVSEHKDRLMAIKYGEISWEQTEIWRNSLHSEFEAAFEKTKLPEKPDYEAANAFLVKARRMALLEDLP
jgi:uncharacterized protein